jgi:3-deoxy-manno-octulosonate cytidylyltransferase (CMP-KDO synthetase)
MPLRSLGIIPARFASTRFPGKPLVMIDGKSMIMRVYEQASKSRSLNNVLVATDDVRILDHVNENGGEAVMTLENHVSGTSRIGEVAAKYANSEFDVIVNIQGDEPFIDPLQIDRVVSLFKDTEVQIGTLISKISTNDDIFNPNVVKVLTDRVGKALYFSRSPVPNIRGIDQKFWINHCTFYRHIGLYAFKTEILKSLINLPESPYEKAESLEQLRWMFHGYSIHTAFTDIETIGIDVPDDLLKLTNNT